MFYHYNAECEEPKIYNAKGRRFTFVYTYVCALTVVALCACVGGHGAVTGVVLPLLDADAHVCTGVLLTCCTRTWKKFKEKQLVIALNKGRTVMEGIQGGTCDGLNVASEGCDFLQGIYSSYKYIKLLQITEHISQYYTVWLCILLFEVFKINHMTSFFMWFLSLSVQTNNTKTESPLANKITTVIIFGYNMIKRCKL